MRKLSLAALVLGLLTGFAHANPDPRMVQSPGDQCRGAIMAAERGHGIPSQLLAAIGRVESGRRDPVSGVWSPWPWTINADGQGAWFETKAEAINAVQALRARGVRSIDVGCMQVNLMHHPAAFASLDLAFEPGVNADYAARFLLSLHDQTGDWTKATANYHSSNPPEGEPYAAKVMSVWPEEQRRAGTPPPLAQAWNRGGDHRFVSPMQPFAARQPPRLLPLSGMTSRTPPGMLAVGMPQGGAGMASSSLMPRILPLGMMQAGTVQPGERGNGPEILPPGMMIAGTTPSGMTIGQNGATQGRALAFYRAAPVRMVMPIRLAARMPYQAFMR